jgi:hypothetical protein
LSLDGFPGYGLVHAGKRYQNVDGGANGRRFTEMSAYKCGDKIEMEKAHEAPIQSSDNY